MKISQNWTPTEEKIAKSLPYLNIDRIWCIVGNIGRYQIGQLCLVSWYITASSWHLFGYIFLGYEPPHVCSTPDNITDIFAGMNASIDVVTEKCSIFFMYGNQTVDELTCVAGHNYSLPIGTSVLSEWDYVCDKRDVGQLPQSLLLAGQGLGAILTVVADYIGRRRTLIGSHGLMFILTFSQAFIRDFWTFAALRFFTGALQQGIVLSAWIYLVELFPTNRRFFVSFYDIMMWATNMLALGAVAYFLQDYGWRTLEIVLSFAAVHAVLLFFFMEESLRWLIVKEKTEESVKLLKKICKAAKVPLEKVLLADNRVEQWKGAGREFVVLGSHCGTNGGPTDECAHANQHEYDHADGNKEPVVEDGIIENDRDLKRKGSGQTEGLMAFIKDPKLLFQSCIIWFAWFVNVLVYFGLFLMPSLTISNRFLQYTLNSAMEIPSGILLAICLKTCLRIMNTWSNNQLLLFNGAFIVYEHPKNTKESVCNASYRLPRKTVCIAFHLIGGFVLLTSSILFSFESIKGEWSVLITILALLGKLAIGTSFYFLFIYTPELFPTYMRSTGIGVASFCGRFGGIIAPFSFTLANYVPWAPGVVFGTCCIVVGILVQFVSETSDKALPQKTNEMKRWQKGTNQA